MFLLDKLLMLGFCHVAYGWTILWVGNCHMATYEWIWFFHGRWV